MIKRLTIISRNLHRARANGGFTLAELIIVIAIFGIISSIVLFNQASLSSNVLLTNMTYEAGLAAREAQVYGLGVKNNGSATGGFAGIYGAHYSSASGANRQVVVYSVDPTLSEGQSFVAGEEKSVYQFDNQRGNKIAYICLGPLDDTSGLPQPCDAGSGILKDSIDVVFKRPEPAPIFYSSSPGDDAGGNPGPAYIVISTADGSNCRVVVINKTGQISVEGADKGHCTQVK